MTTGRLYDIQGFSVQDGPGIRTTAFLKGCPLRCPWCHSPESQAFYKQLSWMNMRCLGLDACKNRCMAACPKGAVEEGEPRKDALTGESLRMVHIKRDLCDNCGLCADKCYAGALTLCGTDWTPGGEPLSQIDFVEEVLKGLKSNGIHTALDTTGFAPWEALERTVSYVDLYLYDLKHMDSAKHKATVGVPNEPIRDNARKLAAAGKKLQVRIPVIPMFNWDEENIRATAAFCAELGDAVEVVQLLPYHNMGVMKYLRISDGKPMEATPPSDEKMAELKSIVASYGLNVTIH